MPLSSEKFRSPEGVGGENVSPPSSDFPPEPIDALVAPILQAMGSAWERGERPQAEEFLDRHPEVRDHSEAAVRVIFEEVCLRQEYGLDADPHDFVRRFPRWQKEL